MQGGKKENHPHLDPLPLACWSHTASRSRERNVTGRGDCSGTPSLAMTGWIERGESHPHPSPLPSREGNIRKGALR